MPIIVDANIAADTLLGRSPDFKPIFEALFGGKARMVYGGKLTQEYSFQREVIRRVAALDRAGVAIAISDVLVNARTEVVVGSCNCVSNDQHIIALAQLSGARLLCTLDANLQKDFCRKDLIDAPRGKVYQRPAHSDLIRTLGK